MSTSVADKSPKNRALEDNIRGEILDFIHSRKSLNMASIDEHGLPFSSYAPFALGEECLYVLLSEIAVHAINLQYNPKVSVLLIQDEDSADELFARVRVNYAMDAEHIVFDTQDWSEGLSRLVKRHGERIANLAKMSDFKLFKLVPNKGRYVKGFGRAYSFGGHSLSGEYVIHLRDGHKKRGVA
jgi:hypothetical protein